MTSVSIPLITLTRILLFSRNNPFQSFDRKGFIFSLIYFHDGGKSFKVDDKKKKKRKRIYTLTKVDKIYAHLSANRYHRSNLRFSALLTPRVPCRVALSFIKFKGRSSIFINSKKKERGKREKR